MALIIKLKRLLNWTFVLGVSFFTLFGQLFSFLPIGISKIIIVLFSPYIIYNIWKDCARKNLNKRFVILFALWLFAIFLALLTVFVNQTFEMSFVYSLLLEVSEFLFSAYLIVKLGKDLLALDEVGFIKLLTLLTFIQGVFIILSFYSLPFREFLNSILPFIGNIEETDEIRMRGLANSSGATASLVQSIGYLFSLVLIKLSNKTYKKIILFIILIVQFLSIMFTGRSGLIAVTFFTLVSPFIFSGLSLWKGFKTLVTYLLFSFLLLFAAFNVFYDYLDSDIKYLVEEKLIDYAFEPFIKGAQGESSASQEGLATMFSLPKEVKTWIIGDGLYTAANGGNYKNTDSGYMRTLFYFGILGMLSFYIYKMYLYIFTYKKLINPVISRAFLMLMLILIILQIKEPFMSKPELVKISFFLLFIGVFGRKQLSPKTEYS